MSTQSTQWNESPIVDAQVEELLQRLSIENKVDLVSGNLAIDDAGNLPDIPKGIPVLALADGPAGLRLANPTLQDRRATAMPAPIALAATWDPELASRYGHVLGSEAVASGHNILLGPAVDIARVPRGGRTFESFGEDPLLQARLVVPEIEAIQAHAVAACIKHYILNNQEYQRNSIDVRVDERTLQEIYLPPFAAAVTTGHVAAVMGSYNRINGVYACENHHTLTEVLREQLGFRGFVISDFLANHSTVVSAEAGLDWELGAKMWGPRLLEAVRAEPNLHVTIDEMARHILRPIIELGLVDPPLAMKSFPVQLHSEESLAIAGRGIVLLKNTDGFLPLDEREIHSIAVIGPDADNISAAGGGSACVQPIRSTSVLEGVRRRAGERVRVAYVPGVYPVGPGVLLPGLPAIPSTFFTHLTSAGEQSGLLVEYWDNPAFEGEPCLVRSEPRIEINYGFFDLFPGLSVASPKLPSKPANLKGQISVRWTGHLTVSTSGEYTLALTTLGSARLYIDGQLIIDSAKDEPKTASGSSRRVSVNDVAKVFSKTTQLTAKVSYSLIVEYSADAPGEWRFHEAMLRLGWRPPAGVISSSIEEAVALARRSDVAVVVARTYETEEMDRPTLQLPNQQDLLIRSVAAANPRTIVVLMSGAPVKVDDWQESVPSILEAWYAGQEQGNAVARVLFGDINPCGKLPLTFPKSMEYTPVAEEAQYPGKNGAVHYSEGIFVGYRGYDQYNIEPQYPFGHGLSYTSFAYSHLQITPTITDETKDISVCFEVTNTGERTGIEIAQVYLSLPAATASPPRQLAGWALVELEPGECKPLTVVLEPDSYEHLLSYWNVERHAWVTEPGDYQIYIGASSRDIRLTGSFCVQSLGNK